MSGFSTARQKMVDGQVRPSDVTDIRILDAMLAVPREAFVPASKQALAYLDLDLDVSEGGIGQAVPDQAGGDWRRCCRPPRSRQTDRVLVVGCATGYAAAVIGQTGRAGDGDRERSGAGGEGAGHVWPAGCGNVTVRTAAAAEGDPAGAPYDVIVLNGATEIVPERLYGQLREGGRLVGVFATSQPARATIVTRFAWRFRSPDAVRCRCPGAARHGTGSGLRFLAVSAACAPNIRPASPAKSRSKSEVWPDCPT